MRFRRPSSITALLSATTTTRVRGSVHAAASQASSVRRCAARSTSELANASGESRVCVGAGRLTASDSMQEYCDAAGAPLPSALVSTHIAAGPGEIADTVLLPGDPLRAEWMAQTYLDDPVCYSRTRNMLGFTGTYRDRRLSVQGTGMGQASLGIYVHELITEYGACTLSRWRPPRCTRLPPSTAPGRSPSAR